MPSGYRPDTASLCTRTASVPRPHRAVPHPYRVRTVLCRIRAASVPRPHRAVPHPYRTRTAPHPIRNRAAPRRHRAVPRSVAVATTPRSRRSLWLMAPVTILRESDVGLIGFWSRRSPPFGARGDSAIQPLPMAYGARPDFLEKATSASSVLAKVFICPLALTTPQRPRYPPWLLVPVSIP